MIKKARCSYLEIVKIGKDYGEGFFYVYRFYENVLSYLSLFRYGLNTEMEKRKKTGKKSIRNLFLNSKNEREPTQKPGRGLESIMGKNSALKFEKDMITGERFIQRIGEMPAFVFLILSFYFLPTGIAFIRGSSEKWWILLLNLLIGWTGLGYVVCAFFAFSEEKR